MARLDDGRGRIEEWHADAYRPMSSRGFSFNRMSNDLITWQCAAPVDGNQSEKGNWNLDQTMSDSDMVHCGLKDNKDSWFWGSLKKILDIVAVSLFVDWLSLSNPNNNLMMRRAGLSKNLLLFMFWFQQSTINNVQLYKRSYLLLTISLKCPIEREDSLIFFCNSICTSIFTRAGPDSSNLFTF